MLVEVLQVEELALGQLLGGGVVGDGVYGECGLRDPVDDTAVGGDWVGSKNLPEPIITAGSFQSPVMKISVLCPNERVADE